MGYAQSALEDIHSADSSEAHDLSTLCTITWRSLGSPRERRSIGFDCLFTVGCFALTEAHISMLFQA